MPTVVELDNEEKIRLVDQHLRSLKFADYNADLDLIEASAIAAPDADAIAAITLTKNSIAARIAALLAEKDTLVE